MAVNRPSSSSEQPDSQNMIIVQTLSTGNSRDNDLPSEHTAPTLALFAETITDAHNTTCLFSTSEISEILLRPQNIPGIVYCHDLGQHEFWVEIANRLTLLLQYLIEFAKMVPGLLRLSQDDQVVLVTTGVFEMAVIRVSRYFDPGTNSVLFGESLLPFDAFLKGGDVDEKELVTSIFDVARVLSNMKLSETQLGLYSAYILLSPDRAGLKEVDKVRNRRERILISLRFELSKTHRDPLTGDIPVLDTLISLVPKLKEISLLHLKALRKLRETAPNLHHLFPILYRETFGID